MPTADEIEAGKSPKGGWTKKQLATWGVPWPPEKGWKDRLIAQSQRSGTEHPATKKQRDYIFALMNRRDVPDGTLQWANSVATAEEASALIQFLLEQETRQQ